MDFGHQKMICENHRFGLRLRMNDFATLQEKNQRSEGDEAVGEKIKPYKPHCFRSIFPFTNRPFGVLFLPMKGEVFFVALLHGIF